jgi:hypothetical protein
VVDAGGKDANEAAEQIDIANAGGGADGLDRIDVAGSHGAAATQQRDGEAGHETYDGKAQSHSLKTPLYRQTPQGVKTSGQAPQNQFSKARIVITVGIVIVQNVGLVDKELASDNVLIRPAAPHAPQ